MRVLVFGATGSAGGSVLNVCLEAPVVDEVQVVTRRPLTKAHAKLRVITHSDFLDYSAVTNAFERSYTRCSTIQGEGHL